MFQEVFFKPDPAEAGNPSKLSWPTLKLGPSGRSSQNLFLFFLVFLLQAGLMAVKATANELAQVLPTRPHSVQS